MFFFSRLLLSPSFVMLGVLAPGAGRDGITKPQEGCMFHDLNSNTYPACVHGDGMVFLCLCVMKERDSCREMREYHIVTFNMFMCMLEIPRVRVRFE